MIRAAYWPAIETQLLRYRFDAHESQSGVALPFDSKQVRVILDNFLSAGSLDARAKQIAARAYSQCDWIEKRKIPTPEIESLSKEAIKGGSKIADIDLVVFLNNSGKTKECFANMKKAADVGVTPCMLDLARHYFREADALGDGNPKRDELFKMSYQYYLKAANKNVPEAFWGMGYLREHGLGAERNIIVAYNAYAMGAKLGDPDSMVEIGVGYLQGKFKMERNTGQAVAWFNSAMVKYEKRGEKKNIEYVRRLISDSEKNLQLDLKLKQLRENLIIERDVNNAMRRRFGPRG